jgi:hypothetical protein
MTFKASIKGLTLHCKKLRNGSDVGHQYSAVPLLRCGRADRTAWDQQSASPPLPHALLLTALELLQVHTCPNSCVGCEACTACFVTRVHAEGLLTWGAFLCRGLECTGTLIGPKHVVTAAHCVFDINDSRQYVSSLNFVPGENGSQMPYGQNEWSAVRVLSQFTDQVSLALMSCPGPCPCR